MHSNTFTVMIHGTYGPLLYFIINDCCTMVNPFEWYQKRSYIIFCVFLLYLAFLFQKSTVNAGYYFKWPEQEL